MVPAAQFPHWGWVALALATPVVFWSAWPFHRAAAINARHFASTMDTLVSIGVLAAYFFSLWQLIADPNITAHTGMSMSEHALYFETAGVVATFLLLGRYLEARAKARAGDALKTLLDLGAKEATVLRNGVETKIAASELVPGDEFVVRPGEKIATDGFVVSRALGRRHRTGHRRIRASRGGTRRHRSPAPPSTPPAGWWFAPPASARTPRWPRWAAWLPRHRPARRPSPGWPTASPRSSCRSCWPSPCSPLSSGWSSTGDLNSGAFAAAVAVLVIACPCALGPGDAHRPLVGTGRGAQLRHPDPRTPQVLEDTRKIDTVLLDKTGTITEGSLAVASVTPVSGVRRGRTVARWPALPNPAPNTRIAHAIVSPRREGHRPAGRGHGLRPPHRAAASPGHGRPPRTVVAGRESWLKDERASRSTDESHRASLAAASKRQCHRPSWSASMGPLPAAGHRPTPSRNPRQRPQPSPS